MFKDEVKGEVIDEFVGLRAKLYSYKMFEDEESKKCKDEESKKCKEVKKPVPKKCKGIKKSVIEKSIAHEDYKRCLFMGQKQLRKMNVIRSHKHKVNTEEVNKIALCPHDDKRHIMEDGVHTLALGHYMI